MEPTEKAGGGGTVGSAAPGFEGGTQNSATTLKNLGYQCGYQSLESKLEKKNPKQINHLGFYIGGARGIRTLDEALHPILP